MAQRPAWFRLSSLNLRQPAPTPTPTPAPAPARPLAPAPGIGRPAIPFRGSAPGSAVPTAPPSPPAPATAPTISPVGTPAPPASPPKPPVTTPAPPASPPKPPVAAPASPASPPKPPVAAPAPPTSPPKPPVASPAPPASPPKPPVALPVPAAAPPRSPVAPPVPAAAPPRSPVAPPVPAAAPSRSPVAPPVLAPAPLRSPVAPPAPQPSPERAPAAAPPPAPPTSPVSKATLTASPRSFQQPSSPVPRPVGETVNGKAATPVSSPKVVKPFERSPAQTKPLSHPPSPLTLPPSKMKTDGEHEPKIEQKTVLVQETIDKPIKMQSAHNHGGIASHGKREPTKKDKDTSKKLSDSEEFGMRVITLAGENKGAVMELSPSRKKTNTLGNAYSLDQKNKNAKAGNSIGYQSGSESGEEGKSSKKDKTNKAKTMQSPPMTAFFNSNVQGLNNSIVHNSICRHNDPGIHLSLTRKANGNGLKD